MATPQDDDKMAVKLLATISARLLRLREEDQGLGLRFRILGDVPLDPDFDTFVLRVDWEDKNKIYIVVSQKEDYYENTGLSADTHDDFKHVLEQLFWLYKKLEEQPEGLDEKLGSIFDGVSRHTEKTLVLFTTHEISADSRISPPATNSRVEGKFQIANTEGFTLSMNDRTIIHLFSEIHDPLLKRFVSNLLLEDARVDNKFVMDKLQFALKDFRRHKKWENGDNTAKKYLDSIKTSWGNQTIISEELSQLFNTVRDDINSQHQTVQCDESILQGVKEFFQQHDLTYVWIEEIPPMLRCSRTIQALDSDKYLIVTEETLEEWKDDILEDICKTFCKELVLSVISIDYRLQVLVKSVIKTKCRVRVVSPLWKDETDKFLQSLGLSYKSWPERWSKTERNSLPAMHMTGLDGAANVDGPSYEYKMAALLALRAKRQGLRFQLHSNVKAAKYWDDVVLRVEGPQPVVYFIQLKHVQAGVNVRNRFQTYFGDEKNALGKYFRRFQEFREKQNHREELTNNDEWILCRWNSEDFRFVMYTTASLEKPSRQSTGDTGHAFPFQDLLETGNGSNTFSYHDGSKVWKSLEDDVYRQEFLPRLRMFGSQSNVNALDNLMRREIDAIFSKALSESEEYVKAYVEKFRLWAKSKGGHWAVTESSGELEAVLGEDLRRRARAAAEYGVLTFQEDHCVSLREALALHDSVLVVVREVECGHRAAKLQQVLDHDAPEQWVYIDDKAVSILPPDALFAACKGCKFVVVDLKSVTKRMRDFFAKVVKDPKLKLVALCSDANEYTKNLGVTFQNTLEEDWRLKHLILDAQEKIIKMAFHFQGVLRSLGDLAQKTWPETMRSDVDGPLLGALAHGDAVLGEASSEDDTPHHVPRTLTHASVLRREVLQLADDPSEHLVLSGFSREELEAVKLRGDGDAEILNGPGSPTKRWTVLPTEEGYADDRMFAAFRNACALNLGRNTHLVQNVNGTLLWRATRGKLDAVTKFTKPCSESCKEPYTPPCVHEDSAVETALAWNDRVALLLGESGIGKSSFLRSLAAQQREKTPETWVVVVKLLVHTHILYDMPKEIDETDVFGLLAAAAGVAEPKSKAAQRCLEATLYRSGAVHIFVDGVNNVMPTYKDKALQLLDLLLSKTKAARVWVVSCPEVGASLRRLLCCAPVSLLPLSREQQLTYLRSRWTSAASPDVTVIDRLAQEMVDTLALHPDTEETPPLQMNNLLGRRSLLGVPLNLEVAAEVFADDVKTALETNGKLLKGRVSQLDMFEGFVKKMRKRKEKRYGPEPWNQDLTHGPKKEKETFLPLHVACSFLVWTAATLPSVFPQIFHKYVNEYEEIVDVEKSGILWKLEDGSLQFSHYMFVEYFVASSLFEHHEKSQEAKQLLIQAYRQRPRSKVAFFVDLKLAKGRPFHQAIINNNRDVLDAPLPQRKQADLGGRSALHLAAAYGRVDAVTSLLDAGYDVSQQDSLLKWTALQYALNADTAEKLLERGANSNEPLPFAIDIFYVAQKDLVEVMRLLLKTQHAVIKGFKVSYKYKTDTSNESEEHSITLAASQPLHIAARAGSLRVARLLLENGAEVNVCGEGGRTPLHEATEGRHKDMVILLLSKGADVNVQDNNGRSPVHYAALNGDKGTLEELSKSEFAEINVSDEWQFTPLHLASYHGHRAVVEFLLGKDADVNLKTIEGDIPMHVAAHNGLELATEILLLRGADFNCRGQLRFTPLNHSSEDGRANMAQVQLSSGADVCEGASEKRTPVHVAALSDRRHVLEMLLEKLTAKMREDINVTNEKQFTPFHLAAQKGHREVIEFLLDQGADGNDKTVEGHMPSHMAAHNGHEFATEVLLLRGADIHSRGWRNFTPLHCASETGHTRVARLLLSHWVDVNSPALDSATPLHRGMVVVLLDAGALVHACNVDGWSALHVARFKGHADIVQLLLEGGADSHQQDNK